MPIWLTRLRLRLRATFSRRHDAELRHELLHHLQLLEDEYRAQGLSPAEARRAAHLEFGNATRIQETSHDLFRSARSRSSRTTWRTPCAR